MNRAAPGWFVRRHLISSAGQRVVTAEAVPNSSTGSTHRHFRGNRRSPTSVTPQKPLRSTDGLFKTMARPPKGDNRPGHTDGNRDPPRAFHPGPVASAQFLFGSAGGPHRCAIVSDNALSPEAGAGAHPVSNGVRASATTRPHGVEPQVISPVPTRSPLVPQFGLQLPAPVRCLTCHPLQVFSLQGGFGFLFVPPPRPGARASSDRSLSLIR
jgi:hypothetical protein